MLGISRTSFLDIKLVVNVRKFPEGEIGETLHSEIVTSVRIRLMIEIVRFITNQMRYYITNKERRMYGHLLFFVD